MFLIPKIEVIKYVIGILLNNANIIQIFFFTLYLLNTIFYIISKTLHNHKLRHSYSTNIYSAGTDYKVMEQTMGHSDIRMTLDRYTDLPLEIQKKELQKYVDSVKMLLGDSINKYTKEEKSLNP